MVEWNDIPLFLSFFIKHYYSNFCWWFFEGSVIMSENYCGNCLNMVSFNSVYEYGFCRLHNELRQYGSSCSEFKDHFTLNELKEMEAKRHG